MKLVEIYKQKTPAISFEFFPPKTPEGEDKLFEAIRELKTLEPSFVSMTYGAMGTTRSNTIRLVAQIKREVGIEAACHLTCVGHTRDEIEVILKDLEDLEIENIVALRGDPPKGETVFKPVPNGFRYASELVNFIHHHPRFGKTFSLAVAGYPETHIECRDVVKDLQHLKHKVDQGADVVITQLFFSNYDYFNFVARARKAGIKIPIVPGIMPVTNGAQIRRFAEMCGASIPPGMRDYILRYGDSPDTIETYGIDYATKQCADLLRQGAPGLHFYTLNKSRATREIYINLGLSNRTETGL